MASAATEALAAIPHGILPGIKVMLSPHRVAIDRWLFHERRSVREVQRLCRDELGVQMGRKALDSYLQATMDRGIATLPDIPGVVMVDRAEAAIHDIQALTARARAALHDRISRGGGVSPDGITFDGLKAADLIALLKVEVDLYGAKGMADFSQTEEKWRKALHAVVRSMKLHTDILSWNAIQEDLLNDPDFTAVLDEAGSSPGAATAKRQEAADPGPLSDMDLED